MLSRFDGGTMFFSGKHSTEGGTWGRSRRRWQAVWRPRVPFSDRISLRKSVPGAATPIVSAHGLISAAAILEVLILSAKLVPSAPPVKPVCIGRRSLTGRARLAPRTPQRSVQPLLFFLPKGVFGLRFLLESLHLGLDGRDSWHVFARLFPARPAPWSTACWRRSRALCLAASSFARSRSRRFRVFSKARAAFPLRRLVD